MAAFADPLAEIDGMIRRLEDDRTAWQHQLEQATTARVAAEHLIAAATAQEDAARGHARSDTAELDLLRDERALLVPTQRKAANR